MKSRELETGKKITLDLYIQEIILIQYKMANYTQLLSKLQFEDQQLLEDCLKKLIYLAVNDQKNFQKHVGYLLKKLPQILSNICQPKTKLLCLQLMSEMATNFQKHIPAEAYDFPQLISFLSDDNAEVRKAAHYLLLTYVKKYEQIDSILKGYHLRIQTSPQQWKTVQKIIHSFESLLIIEPKCVTYGKNYEHMDSFIEAVLQNRENQNNLIKKASQQAVSSFVKNEYVPIIINKLNEHIIAQLKAYAEKNNINFISHTEKKAKITKNINLHPEPKKQQPQPHQSLQLEQIQLPATKSKHSNKVALQLKKLVQNLDTSSDWKIKSQTIQQISNILANSNPPLTLQELPEDLLDKILQMTYDYNFKTCISAMNIITILINDYIDIILGRQKKLEQVIVDKVCDIKMAVRQIANRILRKLYTSGKYSKSFLKFLLNKLNNCSVIGKQQILSFFQQIYSTHKYQESELNNLTIIVAQISTLLSNENTKIKIKAIDCLVKLTEVTDADQCKKILQKKLNRVYYDMYLERLRDRPLNSNFSQKQRQTRWDNQNFNINKGATWQAQQKITQIPDKPFKTKVEFNNRRFESQQSKTPDRQLQSDEIGFQNNKKISKNFTDTLTTNRTAKTFNTFGSTQDTMYNNAGNHKSKFNHQQESVTSLDDEENLKKLSREAVSIISSQSTNNYIKTAQQVPKIPMKPNPVKKRKEFNEQGNIESMENSEKLVIQSRQYINKNGSDLEEIKQQKSTKFVNLRNKKKEKKKQEQNDIQRQTSIMQTLNSKPLYKSSEKKEHQIDYKATHYIAKQQLLPLEDPKQALKSITQELPKDGEWNKQFDGLNKLRRLIKHHQDFYHILHQSFPAIVPQLLKLVQSLRSSLAKNAMITLSQMCEALKKYMDPFLDTIFAKLFKKAQDANTFIVQEVKKCITSLCAYCSTPKILHILLSNSQNKSKQIKLKIILSLDKLMLNSNYSLQLAKQNPKIVGLMSNYITDSSSQVRGGVKQLFLRLGQNNSKVQIENLYKRSSGRDAWEKWKSIMQKQMTIFSLGSKNKIEYN